MKSSHWRTITLLAAVVWLAGQSAPSGQAQGSKTDQETWPAQFPHGNAIKVFENDKITVWDRTFETEPFMHKHVVDEFEVLLEDGPVRSMGADGKLSDMRPHVTRTGEPGFIGYFKAGLGPHALIAADPNHRPRVLYIEMKGTDAPGLVNGRWPK